MHISEGVLSAPVLACGYGLAALGVGYGMRKIRDERLVPAALLTSAFFVASLVHVPIGPASVHLVLSGLLGILLGFAAFPAIFTGLLLQAVLFQFGGLTVLGVNTVTMALPAALLGVASRPFLRKSPGIRFAAAFATGFLSLAGSALLTAAALAFSNEGFVLAARMLVIGHLPVMLIEGALCGLVVSWLSRVRPGLFAGQEAGA